MKAFGGDLMNNHINEMDLYEYIDDILEASDKVKVSNHLSMCPECRQKMSEIKLMYYELDHLDAVKIPEELEAIRQEIVASAFEGEKIPKLKAIKKNFVQKKKKVTTSFVGRHVIEQGENLGKMSKGVLSRSKKIIGLFNKKNQSSDSAGKKRFSLRRLL
jgi:ribosome-binding ATPase YchF (GTP1/OBG family)